MSASTKIGLITAALFFLGILLFPFIASLIGGGQRALVFYAILAVLYSLFVIFGMKGD